MNHLGNSAFFVGANHHGEYCDMGEDIHVGQWTFYIPSIDLVTQTPSKSRKCITDKTYCIEELRQRFCQFDQGGYYVG